MKLISLATCLVLKLLRRTKDVLRIAMKCLKVLAALVLCFSINIASEVPCSTKLGFRGSCLPITDCPYVTELFKSDDLNDLTPCESDGSVGYFCCPSRNSSSSTPSFLSESCRKMLKMKEQLTPNITSYDEKSLTVSIGELPHMVQVMFPEKGFVGAGVLISEKFALTSAHVVYVRRSMPIIRLGKVIIVN